MAKIIQAPIKKSTSCFDLLIKSFQSMGYKYSIEKVFCDFMYICAAALQNPIMKQINVKRFEEIENEYLLITKKYKKEDLEKFTEMFAYVIEEHTLRQEEENISDLLGEVFHSLELHNKYKGQFFTPQHICDFIGAIAMGDTIGDIDSKEYEKGYISLCEPCVGSGAMVFGATKSIVKSGFNYQTDLLVQATDIDLKCVCMAFIQFSLYGIPAIVTHGNSLTFETWSTWYTPSYLMQDWTNKEKLTVQLKYNNYQELERAFAIF